MVLPLQKKKKFWQVHFVRPMTFSSGNNLTDSSRKFQVVCSQEAVDLVIGLLNSKSCIRQTDRGTEARI